MIVGYQFSLKYIVVMNFKLYCMAESGQTVNLFELYECSIRKPFLFVVFATGKV